MRRIRDFMNNNPSVVTIGAVLLLIIALFFIVRQMSGPSRGGVFEIYYYDLSKAGGNPLDALVSGKSDKNPPIDLPSGAGMGVQAIVYTCGKCNKSEMFVLYLQKLTDKMKQLRDNPPAPQLDAQGNPVGPPPGYEEMDTGTLVATPDKPKEWHLVNSDQGMKITNAMDGKCPPTAKPKACFPGSKE